MTDFSASVVLVTGAVGGIGQELCRHFGVRGAAIAALDRRAEVEDFARELSADGIAAAAAVADISDAVQVRDAVDKLRQGLGDVDILINNAGVSERSSLEASTPESWRSDIDANLNGAYHCAHAVLPGMKASGGAIVNIGSVNGLGSFGDPAYSAAKAGLISFTRAVAMEYGRHGIRANIICPGTVRTPIWQARVERRPEILAGAGQVVSAAAYRRAGGHREGGRVPRLRRCGRHHRRDTAGGLWLDGRQHRDVARDHA